MRLIDANALLELYDMGEELEEYAGVLSVPIPVIRQNIKDMPTVSAVEVVRCKDCRWRKKRGLCYMISGTGVGTGTGDDFFCSYGERKDNEHSM